MTKTRVLIVEDETIVALDIQDRLTELGYEVTGMTGRGEEALALASSTHPDLVLMDIHLKGKMDGIATADEIRQHCHIPIIYLTAYSDESTLQRAKITEPFGYIIKPFEDREIQSAIEMALYKHQAEERLRENERRYATTLSSIGDGVIATDSLGKVTFMNPVAEKLTGWSLAEAHRRPLVEIFKIVNEETRQPVVNPVTKVLREGKVVGLANHTILIGRDGSEIPIDDCASPIVDDHNQITGTVLVFQDVSERRILEQQQKESEQQYRILFASNPHPMWVCDLETLAFLAVNNAAIRHYGYSRDEFLAMTLKDIRPPEQVEALLQDVTVISEGLDKAGIWQHRLKDGRIIEVEITTHTLVFNNRQAKLVLAYDITERNRMEKQLRENEERLRLALLAGNQGLYDLNLQTGDAEVNREYACMLGYDPDTFQETNAAWRDRLHPDDWEQVYRIYQEYIEGRRDEYRIEHRQRTTSGDWKWILSLGKIVQWDKNGKPLRMLGTHSDITERKQIELQRLEMERHLLHTQKLESLGVLAGGIAHDFNNLLMAILGYADLSLLEVSPVSPVRPKLQEIIKASHRAADLCRQMLAYSGKGQFVIEHMYLNELIQEMIHMLKTSISKKVLLNLNLDKMAPAIEGDPSQVRQVLMNLVINASEAIGDKSGVVTVSTGARYCEDAYLQETFHVDTLPEGLYVSVEVSDTGCGMDRDTQSRIFEPFFTTKFTGRGLGMSAVMGIMRGHKGALKVYSEPGKGTTFRLLFPASPDAVNESPGNEVESDNAWRGNGMVLLVDDEETVLGVGRSMLEKMGFSVITAWDGREAVEIYRKHRREITFVVMDLTMPHMTGEEAFRELRRIDPEVKVFISSGYSEWEISARFAGKSLAGFIQKPYQIADLLEIFRKH